MAHISNQEMPKKYWAIRVTGYANTLAAGGLDAQSERDLRRALAEAQIRYLSSEGSS